jgi:hypothetical protein
MKMIIFSKTENRMRLNLNQGKLNPYIRGKHFQIFYNIEQSKYYIKDLGVGYGSFMKIKTETVWFY